MTGRMGLVAWLVLVSTASVVAQPAAPGGTPQTGVPTDPIRCWWRSSAGAVRVGEPFDVLLTCAVLETDAITVVPDQSGLEPTVVQLPPFEVVGGAHAGDLHTDDRRFFQYRYDLRLIADDVFGRDVDLPALELSYRVRSRGPQGTVIEGRDQTYLLPPIAIRVLELVPNELTDIRDAGSGSFAALEARTLRGRVLLVLGLLFMLLGVVIGFVTVVRRPEKKDERSRATKALLSDGTVLRGVARELTSIGEERQVQGWSAPLVGRALAALRIAGTLQVSGRVSQLPVDGADVNQDGELRLRGGWFGRRVARVSGWETPASVGRELARRASQNGHQSDTSRLETLADALGRFTAARFGRDDELDERLLDASLEQGLDVVRQLQTEHGWLRTLSQAVARFAPVRRRPA